MTHSDAWPAQASDDNDDEDAPNLYTPEKRRTASRGGGSPSEFVDETRALLTTQRIGRVIRAFGEVESTNTLAGEWIHEEAPHGAVVVADHQTRGKGRLGRSWIAQAGLNLTFSIILRPNLPSDRLGMLTIAASTSVARTVDRFADPIRASIKWPNDIYLGGRKLCGMLLEASWNSPGQKPAVVLGIGLNVNQDEFSKDIRQSATSLLIETGRIIPRAELFAAMLSDLEQSLTRLDVDEHDVRREYMSRMMSLDDEIRLRFATDDRSVEGVVVGIDVSGGIILETQFGRRVFHAGEVTRAV